MSKDKQPATSAYEQIRQAVPVESSCVAWTHYVTLFTVKKNWKESHD